MNDPQATTGVSQAAMESLARELDVPVEHVEQACERQAQALHAGARIKKFVGVLVTARVRSELRRQAHGP